MSQEPIMCLCHFCPQAEFLLSAQEEDVQGQERAEAERGYLSASSYRKLSFLNLFGSF